MPASAAGTSTARLVDVWATTIPYAITYGNQSVFITVAENTYYPQTIMKLDIHGNIINNITYTSTQVPVDMVASLTSVFVLTADISGTTPTWSIVEFDQTSLSPLNTIAMPYQLSLLEVDPAGKTILTAIREGKEAVLHDTKTGKRITAYNGGSTNLEVLGGALYNVLC
jgi:hypothetical protein